MAPKIEPVVVDGYKYSQGDWLYYKTIGTGPTIMVLHGGPGMDHFYLEPAFSDLSAYYRVVFYDQRGSGLSSARDLSKQMINLDQFVTDLEDLRTFLQGGKIILVGHSWGAILATQYAMMYPQNVSQLILLSAAPFHNQGWKEFDDVLKSRMKTIQPILNQMEQTDEFQSYKPETIAAYCRLLFQAYVYDSSSVNKLNFQLNQGSGVALFKIMDVFKENLLNKDFHMLQDLRQSVTVPTVAIHGDYDPIPMKVIRGIVNEISGAQLRIISQCGHFPNVEQPDDLKDILYDVLQTPNRPTPHVRKSLPSSQKKKEEEQDKGLDHFLKVLVTGLPQERWDQILSQVGLKKQAQNGQSAQSQPAASKP